MSDANLRHRAIHYVEHWWHARNAAAVTPQHPLVAVQELGLTDGKGGGVRGSERRTGRSMPLIRDMDPLGRQMDGIMKHVGLVNRSWLVALESYCEHRTVRKAAAASKINPAMMFRRVNEGLAVVQSEMVRLRF